MKVARKTVKEINSKLSYVLSLDNVDEFKNYGTLFEDNPEYWSDLEKALCDYQYRMQREILIMLSNAFGYPFEISSQTGEEYVLHQ